MKLGHHNVLAEETVTASTEASGFEKENAFDNRTSDFWKPTAVPAWLKATGKMPVGMWMGDTTAETLVGSDSILTGDFASDTNWTKGIGWTISGGLLNIADEASSSAAYNNGATVVDKDTHQILKFTISNSTANFGVQIQPHTSGGTPLTFDGTYYTADGTYTITIPAGTVSSDYVIGFYRVGSHTGILSIDDVSLREAVLDLSTNEKGLGVYGSNLLKSAVADGADLMGYSNFSTSNYLEQPYNTDLDFGTGDFCFMGWIKIPDTSAYEYIFSRAESGLANSGIIGYVNTIGEARLLITDDGNTTNDIVDTTVLDDDEWHFVAFIRNGANIEAHTDGALSNTTAITDATGSLSNISAVLSVGVNFDHDTPMTNGELSLWRAFAYAPTAAQIKTIYDKEKHYFISGGTLPETLISTSATTADYFAMYAHDYAQTGASVVLQYSDDDSTWTNAFDPIFPASSAPIFKTFTQLSHKYWRVYVDGSVQSMGVCMFGVRLDFANGLTFGFAPPALAQRYMPRTNNLPDGEFVGRSVLSRPIRSRLNFNPTFAPAWVRQYWPDLIRHMERKPFFVLPEDAHPDEAVFCWADKIPAPVYSSTFMQVDIPIFAKVS